MENKTYRAAIAFESLKVGARFTAPATERVVALLGAGYLEEVTGPAYVAHADESDTTDDADAAEEKESAVAKRRRRSAVN